MKKSALIASAAVLGLLASPVLANDDHAGKEKCYGVAKAGENSCASANGSHSCATHATVDNDANEWKFVDAGTCAGLGGKTAAPAAAPAATPEAAH